MLLQLSGIHKSFGPVNALRGVDLALSEGEVLGLIGENGAGKSTLMKVLSGVLQADEGTMSIDGEAYHPSGPIDGRNAGIAMIYQELNLAPHLSVEENLTLGIEKHRLGWIKRQTDDVTRILGLLGQAEIFPHTKVKSLSIGKQQLVEIGRALVLKARIVVMDEPTSSLSAGDTQNLFGVIKRLKESGVSVIYISHFLEEVRAVCDRYTVIRDGKTISSGNVEGTSLSSLITDMVGRSVDELYPPRTDVAGDVIMNVKGVSGTGDIPSGVSFSLRRGQILGLAGLVGAGRSETLRTLFGLRQGVDGTISVDGYPDLSVAHQTSGKALQYGFDLLSESRKDEGLALNLSIRENVTLSAVKRYRKHGLLNLKKERIEGSKWIDKLGIRTPSTETRADALSGGNQQKACIARLMHQDNDILFLDEPTRGIDVGSKAEIYRLIRTMAESGKAIVLVSSYLPEIFGVCDQLAVMHRGALSAVRPIEAWKETDVMHFATSGLS